MATVRYLFCHRVLRDVALDPGTDLAAEAQAEDLGPQLVALWNRLDERLGSDRSDPRGLAAYVVRQPGLNGILITLPKPQEAGESYYAMAVADGERRAFYCLERGIDQPAYLTGWQEGPRHVTYAAKPDSDVDAFVADVAELER